MKFGVGVQVCLCVMLLGLTGCGCRIVDWTRDSFYQGARMQGKTLADAQQYVRSVAVYDEFTTQALFDALWLSDVVRACSVEQCVQRYGKSDEQHEQMLRRQFAEGEHFIVFYVLSLYEFPLREKEAIWSIFLEIDGSFFAPVELKSVDLTPEYKQIFGKCISRFKVPYLVKFNACDINNKPLITEDTKQIVLHFRSNEKEVVVSWLPKNLWCH